MAFAQIRILYTAMCPGYRETLQRALQAVDELNLEAVIEQVEIETAEKAVAYRYLGSPTAQVHGKDVEPMARERTDYGIGIRYYRGGVHHPSTQMLREALKSNDSDALAALSSKTNWETQ